MQHLQSKFPACEICGEEVAYLDFLAQKDSDDLVCRSFDCKRMLEQKSQLNEHQFQARVQFQRKWTRTREQKSAEDSARIAALKARENKENQCVLNHVMATRPQFGEGRLPLLAAPSGLADLRPLEAERISKYREFLQDTIEKASGYDCAADVPPYDYQSALERLERSEAMLAELPALAAISDAVCAMCKGGCCTKGGDQAYLSELSIRRHMDANPQQSAQQVLEDYLGRLGTQTVAGACINQGVAGCVLPREMRSDICNGYFCDTLLNYQKRYHAGEVAGPVVVIQRRASQWRKYLPEIDDSIVAVAIVDEGGMQEPGLEFPLETWH